MQTILGANGTISSVLARELKKYTSKIRLVSRNPKKVNADDELFPADLTDTFQVDKAIEGSEIVYLLVGFEYKYSIWKEKWPRLMRDTIDACKKHKARLVFFDNVYMYDESAISHMTEESPVNPPSKKGRIRKDISEMLLHAAKSGELDALIARSADFYGPDNKNSALLELVYKNFLKGKKANWFINAEKKHSFTYTPDAARATALLGNTPDAYNQVWHLPTDPNSLTGKEMIELFARTMKVECRYMVIPRFMLSIMGIFVPVMQELKEMMYQNDRDYFFDSSKFNKRFSFRTTTYEEGVQEIVGTTTS